MGTKDVKFDSRLFWDVILQYRLQRAQKCNEKIIDEEYWVTVNFIQGVTTSYLSGLSKNKLSREGVWEGGVGNKGQFSSDKRELGLGKNGHSFDTKENLRKKT